MVIVGSQNGNGSVLRRTKKEILSAPEKPHTDLVDRERYSGDSAGMAFTTLYLLGVGMEGWHPDQGSNKPPHRKEMLWARARLERFQLHRL